MSSTVPSGGNEYRAHVDNLRQVAGLFQQADELEDEADFYEDLITWAALDQDEEGDSDSQLESLREQARDTRRRAAYLVRIEQKYTCVHQQNHTL